MFRYVLIRDVTAFVSFPFSHAWASDQCSFSRTTSRLCRWQQDYIHNFITSTKHLTHVSFSQTVRKRDH